MNIHQAIKEGNIDEVINLINQGADIEDTNEDGLTPLYLAVCLNSAEIVNILLRYGANSNAAKYHGYTPLHMAICLSNTTIANNLLHYDANSNDTNDHGMTPLHLAVSNYSIETETEYFIVSILLSNGADSNAANKLGMTPLQCAIGHGKTNIIDILLDNGASVNVVDINGDTPLHLAAFKGRIEIVKLLLEKGPNINAIAKRGYTPLHMATYQGYWEIVKLLLDRSADIHAVDEDGGTPLHHAAEQGQVEIVKILINRGANIHAIRQNRNTPIMGLMTNIDDYDYEHIKDESRKEELKCGEATLVLNLIDGDAKKITELMNQNDGWISTRDYLKKQYKIATCEKTETKVQKPVTAIIRECAKTFFNIPTSDKAKNLLKFKIGYLKYEVKDGYMNTVILSRRLRKLEFNIINHIIKFAGFCDSDIDLEHINNPLSSREIVSNETGRNTSNIDSNLEQNIVSYTDCTNMGYNIS